MVARTAALEVLASVYSPELANRRDVLVYLPPSYHTGRRSYPVVYMHDGQNLFDPATSFAGDWGMGRILDGAARRGLEAIVVGVPNRGAERLDEYSPFRDPAARGGGRGAAYAAFLARTLKPLVDRRFRTRLSRVRVGRMQVFRMLRHKVVLRQASMSCRSGR